MDMKGSPNRKKHTKRGAFMVMRPEKGSLNTSKAKKKFSHV